MNESKPAIWIGFWTSAIVNKSLNTGLNGRGKIWKCVSKKRGFEESRIPHLWWPGMTRCCTSTMNHSSNEFWLLAGTRCLLPGCDCCLKPSVLAGFGSLGLKVAKMECGRLHFFFCFEHLKQKFSSDHSVESVLSIHRMFTGRGVKSRTLHSLIISEGDLWRELWLLIALLPDPLKF